MNRVRILRSVLWLLVPVTIVFGQWYPKIGFVVPVVMVSALCTAFYKSGRYFCATFCPRGAFYDKVVVHVSPGKKIPSWFRNRLFRWVIVAVLFGFMVWQISLDVGNFDHWGRVFVRMCLITTTLGVILAVLIHPRTWCSFCPMGTLQGSIGKIKE